MTEIVLRLPEGNRFLSGKEVGMRARAQHKLDQLDNSQEIVTISIEVPVVTSSFILGMFSDSVRKLGLQDFFKKYHFEANQEVLKSIQINAEYSSTEKTALSN